MQKHFLLKIPVLSRFYLNQVARNLPETLAQSNFQLFHFLLQLSTVTMLHTLFFDKFIFVQETTSLKIGIKFNEIWKECGKVRVSVCACVCVCKREKEKEVERERER